MKFLFLPPHPQWCWGQQTVLLLQAAGNRNMKRNSKNNAFECHQHLNILQEGFHNKEPCVTISNTYKVHGPTSWNGQHVNPSSLIMQIIEYTVNNKQDLSAQIYLRPSCCFSQCLFSSPLLSKLLSCPLFFSPSLLLFLQQMRVIRHIICRSLTFYLHSFFMVSFYTLTVTIIHLQKCLIYKSKRCEGVDSIESIKMAGLSLKIYKLTPWNSTLD